MTRHDDWVYLQHMLGHTREAIQVLGGTSIDELHNSRVLQLALLHLVGIVGEAASRVSPETRAQFAAIPWRGMIGMRNRILHGYDTVKLDVLWTTITEDLPPLMVALEEILGTDGHGTKNTTESGPID